MKGSATAIQTLPREQLIKQVHDLLAVISLELLPTGAALPGLPGIWAPRPDAAGARVKLAPNELILVGGTPTSGVVDIDPVGPFMPGAPRVKLEDGRDVIILAYPDAGGRTIWVGLSSETSPQLRTFNGITVYAPSDRWRIPGRFVPAAAADRLSSIHTTRSGERRYDMHRKGWFEVNIDGEPYRFSVDGVPGMSYITFRDAGSGSESYSAGRVVWLPDDPSSLRELDLNAAQLQACAYNTLFPCPLAPTSNVVRTVVRAGHCDVLFE